MRQHAWSRNFRYWECFFAVSIVVVSVLVWRAADLAGALSASGWIAALVLWYLVLGRRIITAGFTGRQTDSRIVHLYRLGVLALFIPLGLSESESLALLIPIIAHLYWLVPWRPTVPVMVALNFVPVLVRAIEGEPVLQAVPACTVAAILSVAFGTFIHRIIDQSVDRYELIEELKASRAEVERLSHEAGVASERRRLSAELHDTVTQGLSSIVMLSQAVRASKDAGQRGEHLDLIEQTARANLAETRAMVETLATDDAPEVRADTALAELAEAAGAGFEVDGEPRHLAPATAVALVRAVQELLRNVDKHASGALVRMRVQYRESEVVVLVSDDGPGFDPSVPSSGFGLVGTRNRIVGLGGGFAVESAPGQGAMVRLEVPA
ncbi:sensor histidine kinase [Glycomyces sp. NRRL B-16210]|uniref:sensor histidine kinase n=1 Tax=Glycomyces sp. NRRL B-16210 TaxID=1463821 RepID=UPI0010E38226|nr:sensor histidine kinase [Glycomyces sp. NRRL B-16210]